MSNSVIEPLSSFLTPPPGQIVVISSGKYYFRDPSRGVANYTPVPQAAIDAAKNAQIADAQAALLASGMSNEAIAVFWGAETPKEAGLIPSAGMLVSVNGAEQVIAWQRPIPAPYGNPGYVAIRTDAPISANLPIVAVQTNAAGQLVSTGRVIDPGATTRGNSPLGPEPDTPVAALPSGVFVGKAIPGATGAAARYATNADDTQASGARVLWLNTKGNGAPAGAYQKHVAQNPGETPMGSGVMTWYEAIPMPESIAGLVIG
jgi:hypothetical protein